MLPAGIYDQLSPDATIHRAANETLLNTFAGFGYAYVCPPLIEFESGLFTGSAASLSTNAFRLVDPLSQQMLAIRSDITIQIARIAASRLQHAPLPLRLSYAGDVLRAGGDALHHERQLTQAGIELIGVDTLHADIEVIRVAIEALSALGIEHISIDFSLPGLKDIVLECLKLNPQERSKLEDAIARKDPKLIAAHGGKQSALLLDLCAPSITLAQFNTLSLPKEAKPLAKQLKELVDMVSSHFGSLHITIDPLEARHGAYHCGVAFSLFARGAPSEIGRGGRYKIKNDRVTDASSYEAVGCSLYVNMLTPLLKSDTVTKRILLPLNTDETAASQLREQGYVTISAVSKVKDWKQEAARLLCQWVWLDGEAVEVL